MAAVTLAPFDQRHLDAAAALLAARQRRNRLHDPELPEAYGHPREARALLATQYETPRTSGVVALDADGAVCGYLLAERLLAEPFTYTKIYRPPRLLAMDAAAVALRADVQPALLRELFAAVAAGAAQAGYHACAVYVPAVEQEALAVWRGLTFGMELTAGIRDFAPPALVVSPPGVGIRRAGPADAETVARLVAANDRHHAGPPLFLPALPENLSVQRTVHAELLADTRSAAFLAERDGLALGLHTYTPDSADLTRGQGTVYLQDAYVLPAARRLGLSQALLATGLAWAAGEGYRRCTVAWNTANLPAARFWRAAGFRPLLHRLGRSM